ncbi:MAG TPA: DUF4933 domain-containing protein [Mediterranea massiliensis]|uniref:DUF4933 domain-containing protein n=1 Tax=Mediterranea massiliensis TaxID=1841865 RepID=A0A921HUV7_9BACT|nr:DUF4933 domain-containing protein [Mediterranea massiliensis]HJF90898.1 DUF4933 domain-containing protein [Mediterranea massiliensis]
MNKLFLTFIMFLLLFLASCRQRRPGMSREEAAAELLAQAAEQGARRQQAAATLDTFAADYRPPAGIKHQPTIIRTGAKVLNVPAALKNVRVLKPNALGILSFHPTGYEGYGLGAELSLVDDGWLLTDYEGICLLDKDMKLRKVLFRNDVEISEMKMGNGIGYGIRSKRRLSQVGYDSSTRQLRGLYAGQETEADDRLRYEYAVATLPWDVLAEAAEPWTPDHLPSKLPIGRTQGNAFAVTAGGWLMTEPFSSRLCTFGQKGDTLCRFTVSDAEDYVPTYTYRSGENTDVYYYVGKLRLRMAYDDTVYELMDASTLKAVWRLDFGPLKRPTGKYVVGSLNNSLDGYYLVNSWIETNRYLLVQLSRSYDSPNARTQGTVTLHTLVYDKQTGDFFSLPGKTDKEGRYTYANLPFRVEGKDISLLPSLTAGGRAATLFKGKRLKEMLPDLPLSKQVKDEELVVVRME